MYRTTQPHIGCVAARGDILQRGDHLSQAAMDRFAKDRVLVLEVVVDRRAVDACLLGDRLDSRLADPEALEHWAGSVQNFLALRAVLSAVLALRSGPLVGEGRNRLHLLRHYRLPGTLLWSNSTLTILPRRSDARVDSRRPDATKASSRRYGTGQYGACPPERGCFQNCTRVCSCRPRQSQDPIPHRRHVNKSDESPGRTAS